MVSLTILEIIANSFLLGSVFLAARNSIHTWWLGIIGCTLFGVLFFYSKFYAQVSLMVFYITTSIYGWYQWSSGGGHKPVSRITPRQLIGLGFIAIAVTTLYGTVLQVNTDAFAPFTDSAVTLFSILAQLLLMNRKVESWWFWLIVNSLAIPLYFSQQLYLTTVVYIGFWFNAWYGLYVWRRIYYKKCQQNTFIANS